MGQIRESLSRSMLFMNQGRVLLDCIQHVKDRRQRLVIDLDQLQRILGGPMIRGRHRDDGIANVANSVHREDRLIAKRRTEVRIDPRHLRDIGTGEHRGDTGQRRGLGFVDAQNPRVRVRTSQHSNMEHSRHLDVADMQRPPGDFGVGVLAINRLPDD